MIMQKPKTIKMRSNGKIIRETMRTIDAMEKGMLPGQMCRHPDPQKDHLTLDVVAWTNKHMRTSGNEIAQWVTVHYRVVNG
jgi:hypothetical protein